MAKRNEKTSDEIASIALKNPLSLTPKEIQAVCGSVLTQKERDDERIEKLINKTKGE